jgi:hypothetical protein
MVLMVKFSSQKILVIRKLLVDWRCDSRGKAPTLQARSSEFKHQSHQKKKKKERKPFARYIYVPVIAAKRKKNRPYQVGITVLKTEQ